MASSQQIYLNNIAIRLLDRSSRSRDDEYDRHLSYTIDVPLRQISSNSQLCLELPSSSGMLVFPSPGKTPIKTLRLTSKHLIIVCVEGEWAASAYPNLVTFNLLPYASTEFDATTIPKHSQVGESIRACCVL